VHIKTCLYIMIHLICILTLCKLNFVIMIVLEDTIIWYYKTCKMVHLSLSILFVFRLILVVFSANIYFMELLLVFFFSFFSKMTGYFVELSQTPHFANNK